MGEMMKNFYFILSESFCPYYKFQNKSLSNARNVQIFHDS